MPIGGDHIFMKIKKRGVTETIVLMIFILLFFASQDVSESVPEVNLHNDELSEIVDSLQKELTGYKDREHLFLKDINHEEYIVTAYLPIDSAEGRYSSSTAIGTVAKPYFTVAVDPTVVPVDSWIWIDSLGWWKAQDTGNLIKGKKIDLCLSTREEAEKFGVRKMKVGILK
jgi:3D (Asp-Asp-Asp) domain-containing protein